MFLVWRAMQQQVNVFALYGLFLYLFIPPPSIYFVNISCKEGGAWVPNESNMHLSYQLKWKERKEED